MNISIVASDIKNNNTKMINYHYSNTKTGDLDLRLYPVRVEDKVS